MLRLLARDPGAWEALLAGYGGEIEAVCRRTLAQAGRPRDAASVADAVAEVFRALLEADARALRNFRPGAALGAYLHVIARRRTLDLARKRSPAGIPWMEETPAADGPAENLIAAERLERLKEALSALPGRDAELLRLFHLEGLSYLEISARCGLPAAQLGVLLSRARERLREGLGREFGEFL